MCHVRRAVGDDAGEVAGELGVGEVEALLDELGVGLVLGEDDGLARKLARLVLEAGVHDFFPLLAQRVAQMTDQRREIAAAPVEAAMLGGAADHVAERDQLAGP